jgi:hypothetical protein
VRRSAAASFPNWLSRLDSGIKAWGFFKAVVEHGAGVVVTLDDDCLPSARAGLEQWSPQASFVEHHLRALYETSRWTTTIPGFVPRGLPYALDRPGEPGDSAGRLDVMVNMGVWDTVPDRDAVHDLAVRGEAGPPEPWAPPRPLYGTTRVMSETQYWPMCGMDLAFRAEAVPLMYFPRMGAGTPFGRFDDIWCGILSQRICRHLGWSMSVGRPIVSHSKASAPLDNLVREAPGIRANEELWRIVDELDFAAGDDTPLKCMRAAGAQLAEVPIADSGRPAAGIEDPSLGWYLPRLGGWIGEWCALLAAAGFDRREQAEAAAGGDSLRAADPA